MSACIVTLNVNCFFFFCSNQFLVCPMKHAAVLMTLEGTHKIVPLEDEVLYTLTVIVFITVVSYIICMIDFYVVNFTFFGNRWSVSCNSYYLIIGFLSDVAGWQFWVRQYIKRSVGGVQHMSPIQMIMLQGHGWCCWPQVILWRACRQLPQPPPLCNFYRTLNFRIISCRRRTLPAPPCLH